MTKLDDPAIRQYLLRTFLRPWRQRGGRVVEEFVVIKGRCRADLAVFEPEASWGFEIKSEVDSLHRLRDQSLAYERVFDYCVLVADPKKLEHALVDLPEFWGLAVAVRDAQGVFVAWLRGPLFNPNTVPRELLKLVWHDELHALCKARGLRVLKSWRCSRLRTALAAGAGHAEIKQLVRDTLRTRRDWRQS